MKATTLLIPALAGLAFLTGCDTNGLSSREVHNSYAALINSAYRQSSEATNHTPLAPPIQLAVAQIGEVAPDATLITNLQHRSELVSHVIPLPMPGNGAENNGYYQPNSEKANDPEKLAAQFQAVRNLSREAGAHYLLIVGGSIDSFTTHNYLTLLDPTVIGGFILPAVKVSADGKAAGACIDADTGRVIFLVNTETHESLSSPDAFVEDHRQLLNHQVRAELLNQLAAKFIQNHGQQTATNVTPR